LLAGDDVTLRTLYDGKEFVLFGVGNAKLGHGVIEILAEGGPLRLPIDEVVDDGRDSVDPAESIIEGGLVGIHRRSSPMLKANEETC
jgi:hypothetical protein